MRYLIKKAIILDKKSPFYKKRVDFIVSNGRILEVSSKINPSANLHEISGKNLVLSTAFVDINAQSGEPNNTEAETLSSLLAAGVAGGFAFICHQPSKNGFVENKASASFLLTQNENYTSQIIPIGSITRREDSTKLAEYMEMQQIGARAFSTGNDSSIKMDVLSSALLYAKGFEGRIMVHPEKKELSKNGQINQGIMSIKMGYKGIPEEAEFVAVNEIIQIAEYKGAEVLVLNISSPRSIERIKKSNKLKKRIFSSTSSLYLVFNEKNLVGYDTNFKLNPPLRTEVDMKKIRKAVLDGDIDIVYSQHSPGTEEEKNLEFDQANHGAINLQTAFLSCLSALGKENIEKCIEVMSTNPAQYIGIDFEPFNKNVDGNFTLIDLEDKTIFSKEMNRSKSKNSPFFNMSFDGKIKGLIANHRQEFFS